VVFAVVNDQVNTESLQYKENEQIYVAADKKKNVTQRRNSILYVELKMLNFKSRGQHALNQPHLKFKIQN